MTPKGTVLQGGWKKNLRVLSSKGFTFIELLIYIALLVIFVTGAIGFALTVINAREKSFNQITVEQEARFVVERIAYEIRSSQSINSVSASTLILNNSAGVTTTITLSGTTVTLSPETAGPYDLSGNQVRVTNLIFTNLSSANQNTQNIRVSVTVEQLAAGVSASFTADVTLASSAELKNQFNQARALLVSLIDALTTTGNKLIEGITLTNTRSGDIIIDKVYIDWSGTSGGETITEIQINQGIIEWSGSAGSGSTLDITNYTLTAAAGATPISYMKFNSSMANAVVNLNLIFTDGSTAKTRFNLGTTAAVTCNSYCQSITYSSGICRATSAQCSLNGETYESGGDVYCAGGPSADTCCCAP